MNMFTILGGTGFIGSQLVQYLDGIGESFVRPPRDQPLSELGDMGHVVYCIGLTADFRQRPLETIEAHVGLLAEVLDRGRFESLLYLSSTRVYQGSTRAHEDTALSVNPSDPSDLYNLSKLAGEAACLSMDQPTVRVARLSNVYGPDFRSDNFLTTIIRAGLREGRIVLRSARRSERDYVDLDSVVKGLVDIALHGRHRLYNLASGDNISHGDIVDGVSAATGATVEVEPGAPVITCPRICVERMRSEFEFRPRRLLDDLEGLVSRFREGIASA